MNHKIEAFWTPNSPLLIDYRTDSLENADCFSDMTESWNEIADIINYIYIEICRTLSLGWLV